MDNDFITNRQSYQTAKKPYKKGGIYYTRDGERVKYKSSCDKFDWFLWADKPNPDGEFFCVMVLRENSRDSRMFTPPCSRLDHQGIVMLDRSHILIQSTLFHSAT